MNSIGEVDCFLRKCVRCGEDDLTHSPVGVNQREGHLIVAMGLHFESQEYQAYIYMSCIKMNGIDEYINERRMRMVYAITTSICVTGVSVVRKEPSLETSTMPRTLSRYKALSKSWDRAAVRRHSGKQWRRVNS